MAWMKKMMSAEEERTLAKDLAIYYAHKGKQELALQWFDEFMSLETDQPIATVLYRRAQTKRSLAQPENALVDALRASSIKKRNPDMAMAVVDCMKELNQFENCAIKLNDNIKRFKGNTKERFELGLSVLHENFEDTVGDAYLPFILCNEHALMEAWRENEKNKIVDSRPLWKAQRDKGLCDVMSVIEKEELLLPPVEVARRARAFCVFSQTYVQRSWFEVQFLRQLQRHHALNCKQWKESTPNLLRVVDHTNKEIRAVMSMLHARSPLYNVNYRKYPNKKKFLENLEKTLNHVQYQTRRTMHNALRTIKELQRTEQIDKLGDFIETVMGDYVVVKTSRIMPWKFEFLNEVYNQLALSYIKQYTNSLALFCNKFRSETTEKDKSTDKKNLRLLFILPKEDQMQRPALQFGDKTAYREENINKRNQIAYKKMVDRMEKRLVFAKHEIERAYILHQIGKMHLRFNHYDKCCEVSQKGAKEAKLCNSFIWQILCLMLSCKAQICLQKLEILKDTLTESYVLAELLKSPKMCVFIETCLNLTSELMQSRKSKNRQGSEFVKRPKRSYFSMHSNPSDASIH